MRTKVAFIGIVGLVMASTMFYGSGAAAYFGGGENTAPGQGVVDSAGSERPSISADPTTGGSVAGLVVGSADKIETFVSLAAYWPAALKWLGLPGWFAAPIGLGAEILALLGLAQFISGRVFQ